MTRKVEIDILSHLLDEKSDHYDIKCQNYDIPGHYYEIKKKKNAIKWSKLCLFKSQFHLFSHFDLQCHNFDCYNYDLLYKSMIFSSNVSEMDFHISSHVHFQTSTRHAWPYRKILSSYGKQHFVKHGIEITRVWTMLSELSWRHRCAWSTFLQKPQRSECGRRNCQN